MKNKMYDIAVLGHYTKDTIISNAGTRHVDGGAINYGAHIAACLGSKVVAITRLSVEDRQVVKKLEEVGVDVFVKYTTKSTELVLEYPTDNPDYRIIRFKSSAGSFTVEEVENINSRIFAIGPSIRGEVSVEVIKKIREKGALISLDVQGYIRIVQDNILVNKEWPEIGNYLYLTDVLKADAVEAAFLTGEHDIKKSARILAEYGPKEVVITHRDGVLLYDGKRYYESNFYPRKIVGRSGRGDTVISTYMLKRLESSPQRALDWAAAAVSLKMEAEGPFVGSKKEIESLLSKHY